MSTPWEDGNPDSKIALVGEAPASYEMRAGKPFVGPAGYILDEGLHGAGIVRRSCYITNVFSCEVRKSREGDTFFEVPSGDILWTDAHGFTEKGDEHVRMLHERLAACKANVIVPLGGTALAAVHEKKSVMKWRGSIILAEQIKRKIVSSVHPAAILRGQPIWKYLLLHDLKRVAEEALTPELNLPEREILINPTFLDACAFLKEARTKSIVATDIEVFNHQVSCFSVAVSPERVMSIPFIREGGNPNYSLEDEAEIWRLYAELLSDKNVTKVNQNISFDAWLLFYQMGIFMEGILEDTMVAQHILYPDFPKGLDFICSTQTREPYYKDDGKLWSKPWLNLEAFWIYNAKDAAVALEAWYKLEKELIGGGYIENYRFTTSMIKPLIYMMTRGVLVDKEKLEILRKDTNKLIEEKTAELKACSVEPFDPGSPKQCQKYFYGTLGLRPYLNHKTGRPTTDDLALARIIRRDNRKEARLVQEIRTLNKLADSYLAVTLDADMRLRCSYNIRGTWTGRLSSGKTIFDTGLNMQNIDSKFKGFMIADREQT